MAPRKQLRLSNNGHKLEMQEMNMSANEINQFVIIIRNSIIKSWPCFVHNKLGVELSGY